MKIKIDMTGKKFGKLTAIERAPNGKHNEVMWKCKCDCGKYHVVEGYKLRIGHTTSCGCAKKGINSTHKMSHTRIYQEWAHMKQRCFYPNSIGWEKYGGRGITVCDEWQHDFKAFYDWAMANGYSNELTLDRIDNDKGYCPENCRWTTMKEQISNRSNSLVFYGKTLQEWSEELGIKYTTLWNRIFTYDWPLEKALGKE